MWQSKWDFFPTSLLAFVIQYFGLIVKKIKIQCVLWNNRVPFPGKAMYLTLLRFQSFVGCMGVRSLDRIVRMGTCRAERTRQFQVLSAGWRGKLRTRACAGKKPLLVGLVLEDLGGFGLLMYFFFSFLSLLLLLNHVIRVLTSNTREAPSIEPLSKEQWNPDVSEAPTAESHLLLHFCFFFTKEGDFYNEVAS